MLWVGLQLAIALKGLSDLIFSTKMGLTGNICDMVIVCRGSLGSWDDD